VSPLTNYPYPAWRRIVFVAALIVVIVISFAPSVTQGTVNVRVYGFVQGAAISHIYVRFSEVSLHTAGYPPESGWVTLTQLLPSVDLVPHPSQPVPQPLVSVQIQSGRYDAVRLVAANSTVVIDNAPGMAVPAGSTVNANMTLPVPPSGAGDLLVVLLVDYAQLLGSQPALSLTLLHATTA